MLVLHQPALPISSSPVNKVDISLLLKPDDEEENPLQQTQQKTQTKRPPSSSSSAASSRRPSMLVPAATPTMTASSSAMKQQSTISTTSPTSTLAGTKRHSTSSLGNEPPAKKQSKWSPEEDALIIELRGGGMKWEDISKRLPGRSAISCRLHYQNYLERRSEWDEDRKNKLARLYERFKAEMWAKVAEEMAIPWRAAEAMHWQLGEQEMARRAGVVPFSLSSGSSIEPPITKPRRHTTVMPRLRRQSMSVASVSQRAMPPHHAIHSHPHPHPHPHSHPSMGLQGIPPGLPPQVLPSTHHVPPPPAVHPPPHPQSLPQPLPQTLPQPLQQGQSQGQQQQLPSVEELTAGVPAYTSPITQPIIDPYRGNRPPMPLPHAQHPPSDVPGMSPTMIPRTRA